MDIINIWAVVLATASAFMLGGLWYSLLFSKVVEREAGSESKNMPFIYGLMLVFNIIAAFAFGWLLGPAPGLGYAIMRGLVVGVCFVALSFSINYLPAGRSFKLLLIDGGFHIVRFTLFGLVFGLLP